MPGLPYSLKGKRVWVAGHRGMVGRAIVRRLAGEDCDIVTADRDGVDLRDQAGVNAWMASVRPQLVFLAAARVGGIKANSERPGEFIYDNMMIEANVIEAARRTAVEKLVFLGSSCIYPKLAPQPIPEDALLTGPLEPTKQWYAIAKIAGIKLCQAYRAQYGCDFISAQPTNLYGPFDNFNLDSSHVVPALIRKAHEAKASGARTLPVWGTGRPLRELLHVDDLADALLFLARYYSDSEIVNIGSGQEASIADLAHMIAEITSFAGEIAFDTTKLDGTMRKRVDITRLTALGWQPRIALRDGLEGVNDWYLANREALRS
jgi:GDP-L-fucose synthase